MYTPPSGDDRAGNLKYERPLTGYEVFMDEEGIPVHRGVGVYDVRQLTLAPWKRTGGHGAFIHLDGMGTIWGMYLIEVPAGGALAPERHIYEEIMYVVEGRGSTEVWRHGSAKRSAFEWQAGTLFGIPVNADHRLVNASSTPALLLGYTTAPPLMELFSSESFIFDNSHDFSDRFDESADYFKPRDDFEPHPITGRAVRRSNVIPDIRNCELPLDNQRSPGYRWFNAKMAGHVTFGRADKPFVAQHETGRYSKAHYAPHQIGSVLICLRGKGYTLTWPRELGTRPWEAGKGDQVVRQDYIPGGMVSASPGGIGWFHMHFGVAREHLRLIAVSATHDSEGDPGHQKVAGNADIEEGGRSISYRSEDPFIRKQFMEELKREGAEFTMPESVYR